MTLNACIRWWRRGFGYLPLPACLGEPVCVPFLFNMQWREVWPSRVACGRLWTGHVIVETSTKPWSWHVTSCLWQDTVDTLPLPAPPAAYTIDLNNTHNESLTRFDNQCVGGPEAPENEAYRSQLDSNVESEKEVRVYSATWIGLTVAPVSRLSPLASR